MDLDRAVPHAVSTAAKRLIDLALEEDLGSAGDVTSFATIPERTQAVADVVAKQDLVVCGLFACEQTFAAVDPRVEFHRRAEEGAHVAKGAVVAHLEGPARALLAGERTALNFLQRLSGIATQARTFTDAAKPHPVKILDTRKTTPGWRALEKFAVKCGGGENHRVGLFDGILIKDNHVEACGGVGEAIRRARAKGPSLLKIEVEVTTFDQLKEAIAESPDVILLDNFDLDGIKKCVEIARESGKKIGKRILLEVSGGVTLERIPALAATGVDFLSAGALTHSAKAADLSLELSMPGARG